MKDFINLRKSEILKTFKDKRIAVLYGGVNEEREVSLRSGKNVYDALLSFKEFFNNIVLIDVQDGYALVETLKREKIDFCYNILHGGFGEDGTMQGLLDLLNIGYTGENVLTSSLCMNKVKTKQIWEWSNISTAEFFMLNDVLSVSLNFVKTNIQEYAFPLIAKPIASGSSVGVFLIKTQDDFLKLQSNVLHKNYFVERYIKGTEVTVGLYKGNDGNVTALPILGIYPKNDFYDYEAKYTAQMTRFEIPAKLSIDSQKKLLDECRLAYLSLGCVGMSRIDAIIEEATDNVYLMECNTQGGMTNTSDIPEMTKYCGVSFEDLVLCILGLGGRLEF